MESRNPIIQVRKLSKHYGNLQAVKEISFDVYENEIFGLLGPNGAGKTTTLEIMETLRDKSSGDVLIQGLDVALKPEEIKKFIGVQLQAAGYYPNLTLIELIRLFSGLYNRDVDPQAMLKLVALEEKAKSKYKQLSG